MIGRSQNRCIDEICDTLPLTIKFQLRPQRLMLFFAPLEIPRQLPHPFVTLLRCFRYTEQPCKTRYANFIAPRAAARRLRVAGCGRSRNSIATSRPNSIGNRL
jgi:hypothetical protein